MIHPILKRKKGHLQQLHSKNWKTPLGKMGTWTSLENVMSPEGTWHRHCTHPKCSKSKGNFVMNVLKAIITIIRLGCKQNIPLRGHRDHSTSTASHKAITQLQRRFKKNTYSLIGEMPQATLKLFKSKLLISLENILGRKLHNDHVSRPPKPHDGSLKACHPLYLPSKH